MVKNKKYNKDDLVREIAQKGDFNLSDSKLFVDILIEIFEESVAERRNFNVKGLLSFVYANLPEREANKVVSGSHKTGERYTLPPTTRLTIRPAKNIKAFL